MIILCFTEGHVYTLYIYLYTEIYNPPKPTFLGVARKKTCFFKIIRFFFQQGIWLHEITGKLREIMGKLRANYV